MYIHGIALLKSPRLLAGRKPRTWVLVLAIPFLLSSSARPDSESLVGRLDFQGFKDNIETLADFGTRFIETQSNLDSTEWLAEQLEATGYQVERHEFLGGLPATTLMESIYVTKVGTVHPDQMYIVSAHFDGAGGRAADDDASGCSLVLEAARVLASEDVETDVSLRFMFWNSEEIGLLGGLLFGAGSFTYVEDRMALQGIEDPPGSGIYPEPTWLGIIQHDMLLYDHGLPPLPEQIPAADLDVEFIDLGPFVTESAALAEHFVASNDLYSETYPAEVGDRMCCTDSFWFVDYTAAISVRENRRVEEIGEGSNPHWHAPTDLFTTYSEADFALGFNAAQMTLGGVCDLANCRIVALFEDGFETGDTSGWN